MARIEKFGPDVSVESTDTYLSLLRGRRKFAVVYTTAARMDVGIKLKGDLPVPELVEGRLTPAGSWNSMVTHRVRIADGTELDAELLAWLPRRTTAPRENGVERTAVGALESTPET